MGSEPAALAVMVATHLGDAALHRKALTFQGIILYQTNNPGDALLSLANALRLAEGLHDAVAVAAVWNSLGGAFYEAALYLDALECYERASAVAAAEIRELTNVRSWAMANAALCCLHTHQHEKGIDKIRAAIELMPPPNSPSELLAHVQAEGTFIRLLLHTGCIKEAGDRAALAKSFAASAKSVLADISVACSEGLVEVYSGLGDVGLSRGMQALEKARQGLRSLRETLLAMVQAHERAGRPERALAFFFFFFFFFFLKKKKKKKKKKINHHYAKHCSRWCRHTKRQVVPSAHWPCIAS